MVGGSGIIVIEERPGRLIAFHKKCEHCGHVELSTTNMTGPGKGQIMHYGSFYCPSCKQTTKITIFG